MMRKHFIVILLYFLIVRSAQGEMFKVNCDFNGSSIEVTVLILESIEASELKKGLFFYTYNFKKDSYFLIYISGENKMDLSIDSFPMSMRDEISKILDKGDFNIVGVVKLDTPKSSILLVGNVEKNHFIKISDEEKIEDLTKRVDALTPISNSLIFRSANFEKKNTEDKYKTRLISGDIIIVPFRTTFSVGDNFHRMDGGKILLD